ncbi:MAG: hypothetical protein IJ147_09710 [Lachnospiraceae bacterium]|nr:hypothetical protein [Lachnospiraceae bacterium]MBQ8118316.1 hypothetical protein [Lachnospiraceae bacterium]
MDIIEKVSGTVAEKRKQAVGKAKEIAEIAALKNQVAACEEVIQKNYLEIGKLFVEMYQDAEDAPFEKQRKAVLNAKVGVEELKRKIKQIKG